MHFSIAGSPPEELGIAHLFVKQIYLAQIGHKMQIEEKPFWPWKN